MGQIKVTKAPIEGLYVIEPDSSRRQSWIFYGNIQSE